MHDGSSFKSLFATLLLVCSVVAANDVLKPFVLAATVDNGNVSAASNDAREELSNAGFEVIGEYAPYEGALMKVAGGSRISPGDGK